MEHLLLMSGSTKPETVCWWHTVHCIKSCLHCALSRSRWVTPLYMVVTGCTWVSMIKTLCFGDKKSDQILLKQLETSFFLLLASLPFQSALCSAHSSFPPWTPTDQLMTNYCPHWFLYNYKQRVTPCCSQAALGWHEITHDSANDLFRSSFRRCMNHRGNAFLHIY